MDGENQSTQRKPPTFSSKLNVYSSNLCLLAYYQMPILTAV
jgi:hypothetical protein